MGYFPHDAQVIQPGQDLAGIVSALPSGSRLYLADGTYNINAPLTINAKTGVSIEGGPGAVIVSAAGVTPFVITGCTRVTLRGFTIQSNGNTAVQYDGSSLKFIDLNVSLATVVANGAAFSQNGNSTDITVRGCTMSGQLTYGIIATVGTLTRIKITRNYFTTAYAGGLGGGTAIYITSTTVDCVIANNNIIATVAGCYLQAVNFSNCTRIVIKGNTILVSLAGGSPPYEAIISTSGSSEIVVEGNAIENSSSGVSLANASDIVVRGNVINTAAREGIFTGASSRVAISGNTIRNAGTSPSFDAIRVFDVADLTITGNVVNTATRWGVLLAGTGTTANVVIEGNVFRACTGGGISANPAVPRLIVASNLFTNCDAAGSYVIKFSGVTMTDCIVRGNTIDTTLGGGIIFDTNSTRLNIQNNVLRSLGTYGINLLTVTYSTANNNNIDGTGAANNPILLTTCLDCIVDGNRVVGPAAAVVALYLRGCTRNILNGNRVVAPQGGGIVLTSDPTPTPTTYCVVRSNQIVMTGSAGVAVTVDPLCVHNLISGNEIVNGTGHGITTLAQYTQITSNRLAGAGGALGSNGIQVRADVAGGNDVLVAGNHVTGYNGNGILLGGGGTSLLRVNCNGNYCANSGGDGISMTDCDESMVQSNRCYNNTGWGINQDANSDQDLVSSNHVRGNTAGALQLLGTNLTSVNNKT